MGNSLKYLLCSGNSTYLISKIDREEEKLIEYGKLYTYGSSKICHQDIMLIAAPKLCQLNIIYHEDAKLINSSTVIFGQECIRLVNIAFHTSKMFPSLMSTCDAIGQFLREELNRKYQLKCFHIIISEKDGFGFAIDASEYFADVEQEQYRVLIFSTNIHKKVKLDTHHANDQMILQWKSVLMKQLDD